MTAITLKGKLLGRYCNPDNNEELGAIIHINHEHKPFGPAENAYIYIENPNGKQQSKARYISWINLFDIEHAGSRQPGWNLSEPGEDISVNTQWLPYGWGSKPLPSIADIDH